MSYVTTSTLKPSGRSARWLILLGDNCRADWWDGDQLIVVCTQWVVCTHSECILRVPSQWGTCCIAWGELGGGMGSKSVWSVVGVIDGHSMHAGQRLDTSEVVMVNA